MKDTYFDYDEGNHYLTTINGMTGKDDAGRDWWLITGIETNRQGRGKGRAKKLLNEVLADADREEVILLLSVDPSPGVSVHRLITWYKSVGFDFIHHDDMAMKRFPKNTKPYMLEPKTGFKLAEHLELYHSLDTTLDNVRQMQSKHRSEHLIQKSLDHTHKRPTRQVGK
jgi:N-acetylglutamate synthase-like GNAT family acetyltransferase